jgi:hypothetical protein
MFLFFSSLYKKMMTKSNKKNQRRIKFFLKILILKIISNKTNSNKKIETKSDK